jgi:hypothetical protein
MIIYTHAGPHTCHHLLSLEKWRACFSGFLIERVINHFHIFLVLGHGNLTSCILSARCADTPALQSNLPLSQPMINQTLCSGIIVLSRQPSQQSVCHLSSSIDSFSFLPNPLVMRNEMLPSLMSLLWCHAPREITRIFILLKARHMQKCLTQCVLTLNQ